MNDKASRIERIKPAWWTAFLVVVVIAGTAVVTACFNRSFTDRITVTVTSERSGLAMEPGGKVKYRGIEVGQVAALNGGPESVRLRLAINSAQAKYIPANVDAEIKASTAFGSKFVDLLPPPTPSTARISNGQVLQSRNVTTEVNTVFENVVALLDRINPAKLNAILTTLADGLRGQGDRIGGAITDANQVLSEINPRSEALRADLESLARFSDGYGAAAQDIISTLDAASTTGDTVERQSGALNTLLLNAIGVATSGRDLVAENRQSLTDAVNMLEPTTNLLFKYQPEYTCLLKGAKVYLDEGGYQAGGANGYSVITDTALLLGNDQYVYPDNLPIIAAKGGPGGKPSCGSLPDAYYDFPVRQLVTNTGWGTGMDIRPNPGLGHPCFANYFPVTRAVPQDPTYRCPGLPSPGLAVPPPGPLPFDTIPPSLQPPPPAPPAPLPEVPAP